MTNLEKKIKQCPICNDISKTKILECWQGNEHAVCLNCGVWYQIKHNEVEYDSTYWGEVVDPDGIKRDLTKEREDKVKNWYGETINYVNSSKPGKILDIGAGLGFFLSAISKHWEQHAFDISEEALSIIKETLPSVYRHNDLDNLLERLGEGYFDVIMCYHVVEHLSDPKALIKLISKLLKPGGTLMLGAPNAESYVARRFKGNFRLLSDSHLYLPTKRGLEILLEKSKLEIISMEYPFFKTKYFTLNNLMRMYDTSKLSPPFYGSVMTAYIRKKI